MYIQVDYSSVVIFNYKNNLSIYEASHDVDDVISKLKQAIDESNSGF